MKWIILTIGVGGFVPVMVYVVTVIKDFLDWKRDELRGLHGSHKF